MDEAPIEMKAIEVKAEESKPKPKKRKSPVAVRDKTGRIVFE